MPRFYISDQAVVPIPISTYRTKPPLEIRSSFYCILSTAKHSLHVITLCMEKIKPVSIVAFIIIMVNIGKLSHCSLFQPYLLWFVACGVTALTFGKKITNKQIKQNLNKAVYFTIRLDKIMGKSHRGFEVDLKWENGHFTPLGTVNRNHLNELLMTIALWKQRLQPNGLRVTQSLR